MIFAAVLLIASAVSDSSMTGARNPAYAADGRLALSVRGDIWVRDAGAAGRWTQVTSGPAWDRQPAWTRDGSAIVYTSSVTGAGDLYRVVVNHGGAPATPVRITDSPEPDGEASVARDGTIIFARGRTGATKLWIHSTDGTERRFTKGDNGAERWPAWSPSDDRVAYSAIKEDRTRLRVRWVVGDSDRVVIEDRDAEHASWSPNGDRIAFATRNGRAGVWVTTPDARYVNFLTGRRAEPAWSPDGRMIALAELPGADVGYNGDPDRLGDREARDDFGTTGRLWFVDAPSPPDEGVAATALPGAADRRQRNANAFNAFWTRMDTLYYRDSPARRARWESLRAPYAFRALAAVSDDALEQVIHDALRERPPLRDAATGQSAVSSAHPVATAAGLEVLRKGGNVVDAAIAVSFALGVVEPDASGLGGYGQMVVSLKTMDRPTLIEFMTRAPEEATVANGSLLRRGVSPPDGPILVNVPGTLAGMDLAFKRYGSHKVTWGDVIAPAIRAAEQGYVVSEGLATTLTTEREHFLKYPAGRSLFFPKGEPLKAGDTLTNPDLAHTLHTIADSGAESFYSGSIARRLVADLRGQGNAMRLSDMARYYAAEREAVSGTYRGYTIYSSAPPVSGGATLVSQLNLLEQQGATKPYTEDAATLHTMLESWKLVPGTRGRIADPGLWPVKLDAYLSKDSAKARWRCFNPARALTPNDIRGDSLPCAKPGVRVSSANADEDGESQCSDHAAFKAERFCHRTGTTAFAVADANGNVVSATQTLGTWGGNFYVSPGLGFLYNDKLNSYGSDADEYGARLPYARHGSTLAPTIAFRGDGPARRPVVAAAAAGNAWITSAVYSVVVGVLDQHLDAQRAIELPRFLIGQQRGAVRGEYLIQIEDGFAPAVLRQLGSMGHAFQRISLPGELRMGYAAVITFADKSVTAGADPRRAGAAGAVGGATGP